MDFAISDTDHEAADLARRILADAVDHHSLLELENGGGPRFDPVLWERLGTADLIGLALPEQLGGGAVGLLAQSLVSVEVGRTLAPVPYGAATAIADTIGRFGTDEQIERWVTTTVQGQTVLAAATGERANPDPTTPSTFAQEAPGGWRLTGAKTAVLWATVADWVAVPARIGDGAALFLVDPTAAGVTVLPHESTAGQPYAEVSLDGVEVGADALIGPSTSEAVRYLVDRLALALCAFQLGVVEEALQLTTDYVSERVQFDRPIATFQAVRHRCADAFIDVEAIRLTLLQAIDAVERGRSSAERDVATAMFWACEAGHRVAHSAVHLHGGMGVARDAPTHRYFAFAKENEFTLGAGTLHALRIGAVYA